MKRFKYLSLFISSTLLLISTFVGPAGNAGLQAHNPAIASYTVYQVKNQWYVSVRLPALAVDKMMQQKSIRLKQESARRQWLSRYLQQHIKVRMQNGKAYRPGKVRLSWGGHIIQALVPLNGNQAGQKPGLVQISCLVDVLPNQKNILHMVSSGQVKRYVLNRENQSQKI